MEENNMNNEFEVIELEATEENSGNGKLGVGIAIGALLTAAGIAGVNKVKKAWKKHKDKKQAEVEVVEEDDEDDDFEFVEDEEPEKAAEK